MEMMVDINHMNETEALVIDFLDSSSNRRRLTCTPQDTTLIRYSVVSHAGVPIAISDVLGEAWMDLPVKNYGDWQIDALETVTERLGNRVTTVQ